MTMSAPADSSFEVVVDANFPFFGKGSGHQVGGADQSRCCAQFFQELNVRACDS